MDSKLTRRPLQDALAALVACYRTDSDLSEMMRRLVIGSYAADQTTEWLEEEEFWEAVVAEEEGIVLVAPAPISLAVSVVPTPSAA